MSKPDEKEEKMNTREQYREAYQWARKLYAHEQRGHIETHWLYLRDKLDRFPLNISEAAWKSVLAINEKQYMTVRIHNAHKNPFLGGHIHYQKWLRAFYRPPLHN